MLAVAAVTTFKSYATRRAAEIEGTGGAVSAQSLKPELIESIYEKLGIRNGMYVCMPFLYQICSFQ